MQYNTPGVRYNTPGIIYNEPPQGADGGDTYGDYPAAVAAARQRAATQRRTAAAAFPDYLEADVALLFAQGLLD